MPGFVSYRIIIQEIWRLDNKVWRKNFYKTFENSHGFMNFVAFTTFSYYVEFS